MISRAPSGVCEAEEKALWALLSALEVKAPRRRKMAEGFSLESLR